MEQLISPVPLFNETEAVRLRGELDAELLERALNVIIVRHEILRTTIQTIAMSPWPWSMRAGRCGSSELT